MKILLTMLATFFLTFAAYAAETCDKCMARCPHETKDIRDCDRGCPAVCKKEEAAAIRNARSCESCLSECPHLTRDFRPCDAGCKQECDRDSLYSVLKKNMAKKGCGLGGEASRPAGNIIKLDNSSDPGFEIKMPANVDEGFDMGGGSAR